MVRLLRLMKLLLIINLFKNKEVFSNEYEQTYETGKTNAGKNV